LNKGAWLLRVAILETVKASAGFELEFDRIIIEALQEAGHEPVMMMPKGTVLDQDFHVPVYALSGGGIISYDGVRGLKKLWYSLQRERRRVRWFDSAVEVASAEGVDAILLTTATYRYLRSLKKSRLFFSKIPVYFIFLGVNPQEKPKFLAHSKQCMDAENIHLCITTLRDDFGKELPPNVRLIKPPVMIPNACSRQAEHTPLRIGFFGHYRKGEKSIECLLEAIQTAELKRPVRFIFQLVPTTERDGEEVEAIVKKHEKDERITFRTEKLLQDDWYNAIQSVDVVILPYTAERYLYNWSAIYFTAIGAHKPVLVTRILNPEVMAEYPLGEFLDLDDAEKVQCQIADFVNFYAEKKKGYQEALVRANEAYSKKRFIEELLK